MQDLENEIKGLIAEIIEKKPEEIKPDANFFKDLGVDSMMALEIMAAIEKKYKIAIPEEKLPQLITLQDAVRVAEEYINSKKE